MALRRCATRASGSGRCARPAGRCPAPSPDRSDAPSPRCDRCRCAAPSRRRTRRNCSSGRRAGRASRGRPCASNGTARCRDRDSRGQLTGLAGVMTRDSSAAIATAILNVDPGAYTPAVARLISGVRLSCAHSAHCACDTPALNSDGSNDGLVAIASTSPLRQSSTTALALSSPSRPSTACCSPLSMVRPSSSPGTPSWRSSSRITRP